MRHDTKRLPRIAFVGDGWIKKLHDSLIALYGLEGAVHLQDTKVTDIAALDAAAPRGEFDLRIGTWRDDAAWQGAFDHVVPRFYVDGLSTVEVAGEGGARQFLGADPLRDLVDADRDIRIVMAAVSGEYDFRPVARFDASIDALRVQESVAIPISDVLLDTFRDRLVLNGCKKPAPVLTIALLRRLADRIGLKPLSLAAPHPLIVGDMAFKASRSAFFPFDAEKLGLTFEPDPFWFPTFGGIFKDFAADVRKARQTTDA